MNADGAIRPCSELLFSHLDIVSTGQAVRPTVAPGRVGEAGAHYENHDRTRAACATGPS
jgi:hypothetical protein